MARNLKDLCRLCAKRDEFSKDLMDETNKNVLKLIQDFIQIAVTENDDLPTKICLVCEDKMVSFQLFVLECYNVQVSLRKLQLEESSMQIKLEDDIEDFNFPLIKSEVKDELTAEDIVSAINDEALSVFDEGDYSDDDVDDVTIASLKEMKKRPTKRKVVRKVGSIKKKAVVKDEPVKRKNLTEVESPDLSAILKQPNLQVKDFVKLQCNICRDVVKTWSGLRVHYYKTHKSKPYVTCICGFIIRSKSVLYKHVSDHKLESRKIRKDLDDEMEKEDDAKYSNLNVKDFVTFSCNCCDIQCSSWYSLKAHCEVEHDIQPVVQCICGITLKSKSVLYKHIQDHKNPNVIICDKCPRITKTMAAMNKHKMRHIPKMDRRFCCDSCDKIFNTKDALKSHERSHVPIEERKIYRCDICDMKFTTRSSAASHKRVVHDKIKSYVCDLCGYACGTNGELRQHRAIHSDDKPFVCKKCGKPFKTYSNLKTHMDTHEDTSYACFVCNRVLNSRRTLRKHLLVHEDKCRHVCSYCNKAFKRRQTLKVHMYTHTGDKPLTCKWCDERFAYASTLRSHRLRCHPDKMTSQTHDTYGLYSHVNNTVQEEYLKNDVQAVRVSKNEVEAM